MTIPFIDLKAQFAALESEIRSRMDNVLHHGQYIMGPEVQELEERLAQYTGSKHCITVSSGTDALLMSLMSLDIGPGDEVITTPFTFAATAEVIALLGATPVFVDIEPDTCNIDATLIEARITESTKAIMPVSLYGQPADMAAINSIAERHGGIPVIEDAAQSFGALYQGQKSCNLSTIGCTSFFPSKPLGCYGDGGAIFTNDDGLATACREIRVHGQSKRYQHDRIGLGGRMDTLQCAVVLAKLDQFDWEIAQRLRVAEKYNQAMGEMSIQSVALRDDRRSVYAQYTILVDDRPAFCDALFALGVPTAIHYPIPLNRQPAYENFCCPQCTPISEEVAGRVVSLPMSPFLMDSDQDIVLSAISQQFQ